MGLLLRAPACFRDSSHGIWRGGARSGECGSLAGFSLAGSPLAACCGGAAEWVRPGRCGVADARAGRRIGRATEVVPRCQVFCAGVVDKTYCPGSHHHDPKERRLHAEPSIQALFGPAVRGAVLTSGASFAEGRAPPGAEVVLFVFDRSSQIRREARESARGPSPPRSLLVVTPQELRTRCSRVEWKSRRRCRLSGHRRGGGRVRRRRSRTHGVSGA